MPGEPEARIIEFGAFGISTADRLLHRGGQVIPLFPKAIDTLLVLLTSDGRVLTKEELVKAVWGDIFIEGEGALARNISLLRKALGDRPGDSRYIQTIPRRGYRWVAPITETPVTVVVFPLENLARDPEQNYFSAGMTEALLANLGKIAALKVIAFPGVKPGESEPRPAEIAHSLGAGVALNGCVLHDRGRVRITMHLLEAQTGLQLWADQYDCNVQDVLELQGNVSQQIAQAVRVKLTSRDQARLAAPRPVIPAAYGEYLKGRYHWNRRTPEGFWKAIEHFQRAVAADPAWAPPYAGLADTYLLLGSTSYDVLPPREAMPKAKAAAASALEMDDSNAEAHASLGYSLLAYDWNLPVAEREFRRALELNPGYATAHHWYAHCLLAMGKMNEARAEMGRALERDPLSLVINTGLGWALYLARRYDEAIEQYRKTLDMESDFVLARCMLGLAYKRKRMYAEAIAEFRRALAVSPESTFALAGLGRTFALRGNRKEALRILRKLTRLSKSRYVPSIHSASIYAALGDNEHAYTCAAQACEERSHYLIYLNVDPSLGTFRDDPRFPGLARRIGLDKQATGSAADGFTAT